MSPVACGVEPRAAGEPPRAAHGTARRMRAPDTPPPLPRQPPPPAPDDEVAQGMTLLCMARATSDCTFETQSDWGYSLGVAEWKGATGAFESRPDPLMGTSWTGEGGSDGDGGGKAAQ